MCGRIRKGILLYLAAALILAGCGGQGETEKNTGQADTAVGGANPEDAAGAEGNGSANGGTDPDGKTAGTEATGEKTVLVLAAFEENRSLMKQVEAFNQSNPEYEIQIKLYERALSAEEDGVVRLQREIMSGAGPDLIDFGMDYTTSDIAGKYTEDLLPYLENAGMGGEDFFTNVWDAMCYRGGLYAMPVSFTLATFAGETAELGGRESWNVKEMIECYQGKKDKMLYPGETKIDVFGTILTGSMETYIDWESGECSFDGEAFKQVLAFANTFPGSLNISEDFSVKQAFLDGQALLLQVRFGGIYDICKAELIFGEKDVTYVGFPVEGKCGTVIRPSYPMLAISIGSKHKEAAWSFIRQFLEEDYQEEVKYEFPVRRSVLEEKLLENREPEYEMDAEGNRKEIVKAEVIFEGEEPVEVYCITEEQADKLIHLIESAEICTTTNYQIYNVFLEEAGSYFSGDKSLEDAVAVMQSRASIYVGERVR